MIKKYCVCDKCKRTVEMEMNMDTLPMWSMFFDYVTRKLDLCPDCTVVVRNDIINCKSVF